MAVLSDKEENESDNVAIGDDNNDSNLSLSVSLSL